MELFQTITSKYGQLPANLQILRNSSQKFDNFFAIKHKMYWKKC